MAEGHAIAVDAEHQLLHAVPRLDAVTVHINPRGLDTGDPHAMVAHHN